MEQIAFISGGSIVYWRPLLICAGALTAVLLFAGLYLLNPYRRARAAAAIPLAAALSLLLARLIDWYCRPTQYADLMDALTRFSGGFALLGVFAGCLLTVLALHSRRTAPSAAAMLDCMSVAGCAGICVGRLACFFDSADRGALLSSLRSLPFAYPVTNTVSGATEYRLATFVLQAMCAGLLFGVLLYIYLHHSCRRKIRPGDVCLLFLLLYGSTQAVLDSTRYDSLSFRSNGFVSVVQVFSAVAVAAVLVIASVRLVRWEKKIRAGVIILWVLSAAGLGVAGYMEYYVQRHGSQAAFAYSVMSAALALVDASGILLLRRMPAPARAHGGAFLASRRGNADMSASHTHSSALAARTSPAELIPSAAILTLSLAAILVFGLLTALRATIFVYAGGRFLPASARQLDLTGKKLTSSQYQQIQQALPDCTIVWDISIQGKRYTPDAASVEITDPTLSDSGMLTYLPNLETLDARQCTDLAALSDYLTAAGSYRCLFRIGTAEAATDSQELTIENLSAQQLRQAMPMLKHLERVKLTGTLPSADERRALAEDFPDVAFHWEVSLLGKSYPSETTSVDLSGKQLRLQEVEDAFDQLPALKDAQMLDTSLTSEEMTELVLRYPDCNILWNAEIEGERYRTDITQLDLSGKEIQSVEALEAQLRCFPLLERVDMSHCGIDNETMEALNKRHEGTQFVWTVDICGYDFPTDSTYFFPWKLNGGEYLYVSDEDVSVLRYCHDIECIDIGHMYRITNCEWVRYMPKLKYLIIGETGITDITPLSTCKNLVFLEMFTIQVTDLTPLQGCTALEDLNLGRVYDADPEPLTKMTWLKNVWWANVDGTYGKAASNAKQILTEALPDTNLRFNLEHPTSGGWRQLPNYLAQRDFMGMYHMN